MEYNFCYSFASNKKSISVPLSCNSITVFGYIFYFAKDSVVSKHNCKFDKKFYKFKKLIKIYNEKNKISSKLSDRVGLTKWKK